MTPAESFEVFVTSAEPMLFRTAWALTRNRHTSEDLVQEALARVFARWRRLAGVENRHAYARTTLVRLHVSAWRRRSSSEILSDQLEPVSTEPDFAASITVQRALASLAPLDRAVLVLRYVADLSVTDVAESLRLTESAVRTRTSRAAAKLRAQLGTDFRSLT